MGFASGLKWIAGTECEFLMFLRLKVNKRNTHFAAPNGCRCSLETNFLTRSCAFFFIYKKWSVKEFLNK